MTAIAAIDEATDTLLVNLNAPSCDWYGHADESGECSSHDAAWFGLTLCGHGRFLCEGHRAYVGLLLRLEAPVECGECTLPVDLVEWSKL